MNVTVESLSVLTKMTVNELPYHNNLFCEDAEEHDGHASESIVMLKNFSIKGTGKYINLIRQLVTSMETYFCSNSPHIYVHYFIFTDDINYKPFDLDSTSSSNRNYTIVKQKHLDWPMSTLLRFSNILTNAERINFFSTFDFLYWIDGDMRMVDFVCEDIVGDLVATMHPHYYTSKEKYPYESSNVESRAYLEQDHRFETP